MKQYQIPDSFELLEQGFIQDLNSESLLLRHKKTRARAALLLNDDDNKVFYVGFRTPPKDSTGVAHIIEHTVLCGSKRYPTKDPFMDLVKGSLNTFLNAMTYPDKTVYPVASYNDQDFKNLMSVYMDAVFAPKIYDDPKRFMQEGWHYELESVDDELTINGVVYNEMKGSFSSPESVLGKEMRRSLFPDTTYAIEFGGDPDDIPNLTYEQYLDFHRTYYHPSNSYIYLYGDVDVYERLDWMDREYLSHYDYLEVDSAPGLQQPFDAPRTMESHYSILPEQSEKEGTYLTYNVCAGSCLDKELYIAFDVLDYALCDASGAVLKQALIDAGIGADVYCSVNDGILQPAFSIVAKGAEFEQQELFVKTVRDTLQQIVKDGFDEKALYAGINQNEFQYREADFGRYPKGLMYGLQALDSWLYDDNAPWLHVDAGETFRALKKKVKEGYFEQLLQTCFLDNPHRSVLALTPQKGMTQEKDAALKERLAAYKRSLSENELRAIVDETKALKAWQDAPDNEEDKKKIPMLTRADLKREVEPFYNEERRAGDAAVLYHEIATNGVCYVNFIFDMERIPKELYPYAGLLKTTLGMVDTAKHTYADLANEVNIRTGGFSGSINTYSQQPDPSTYLRTFEIGVKVLRDELQSGFDLATEILTTSDFRNQKRVKEILDEIKSRMQDDLSYGGHQAAAVRALSHISETAYLADKVNGIGAYRLVEELDAPNALRPRGKLSKTLDKLAKALFRKENLLIDFTAPKEDYEAFRPLAEAFADRLFTEPVAEGYYEATPQLENEAFQTAGQVQFVCRAGNYRRAGLEYTGRLRLLKSILSTEYFWNAIRVKGGAYGCMTSFGKNGDSFFVTYRDPHLKRSVDVFEQTPAFVRSFEADERTLTQFLIGAISELDVPKTPSAKGSYGLAAYLTKTTMEQLQKDRDELLNSDAEKIRALAPYIDAILQNGALCVVGAADKVTEHQTLFDTVDTLFHDADGDEEA